MKNFKNTLIISSYVLVVALLFFSGYFIGRKGVSVAEPVSEPVVYEEGIEAAVENTSKTPVYEVKAENGKIVIYKRIGNDRTVITSEKISESVFPKEDIEELRRGIMFERLESAQHLFENFVS